jgi:hypothetical protein
VKAALNHADIVTTQKYLEADADRVLAAIQRGDFTRHGRTQIPFSLG